MTDTQKKVGLGAIVVIALGLVIWQASSAIASDQPHVTKVMTTQYSAGHSMKDEMRAADQGKGH